MALQMAAKCLLFHQSALSKSLCEHCDRTANIARNKAVLCFVTVAEQKLGLSMTTAVCLLLGFIVLTMLQRLLPEPDRLPLL